MNAEFVFDTVARKPQIVSECLDLIREHFSVEDKALVFMRRRTGRSNMPVRKYAITNKGHFDLPFFKTIYDELRANFPSLQLKISSDIIKMLFDNKIADKPVKLNLNPQFYPQGPRDYQLESATLALQKGQGLIILPTSAGKTLTIALIVETAIKQTRMDVLILVPNIQLVSQTYNDFIEYGIDKKHISKWTGDHAYQPTSVVIANNQILLSKTQDVSVLNRFHIVICDEVHKIGTAEKISKLVKQLPASHKFGFTGSLPENTFEKWSINKIFGPIIYEKLSTELRDQKFISKVRVVSLEMTYKNVPAFTKPNINDTTQQMTAGYHEEIEWIQTQEYRNATMARLLKGLSTNTLVLVDRILHGELLLEYFKQQTDKEVYFIKGSVELEEREKVKQVMERSTNIICIAMSNIFSTGISVKNLHNVLFASIGKARIKIIQSIGRTLRLHHTKEIATIFDIADVCLPYGGKHYEKRKSLYVEEKIPIVTKQLVEP